MHYTCRSFIGKSGPNSWCQYWENEPDDRLLFASNGHLFGLVAISGSQSDDIKLAGHQLINNLNIDYFQPISSSLPLHQKNTTYQATTSLSPSISLNTLILAVVHQHHLYLSLASDGVATLIRQGQISQPIIIPQNLEFYQMSGPLKSGDRLLLATNKFYDAIGWEKIKTLMLEASIATIEENILLLINGLSSQDLVGASLIEIHDDEDRPALVDPPQSSPTVTLPPKKQLKLPRLGLPHWLTPRHPVFVASHQSPQIGRRQRFNLIIGLLLLVALGTSITIGFKKNQASQAESRYQQLQTSITKVLSDGFASKNLNIDVAKELGKQSEELLKQMKSLKTINHQNDISQFEAQIRELLSQTGSGDPTQSAYDTSLIADNPTYEQVYFQSGKLYLVDTQVGRIDVLATEEKSTNVLSQDPILKSVTRLMLSNDKVYGLTSSGIIQISKNQSQSLLSQSNITDAGLWNGTMYLLDVTNNTIQKVAPNSTGLGSPQLWLKDNQSLPPNSNSIAINGKIWVLSANGSITPYLRGQKDVFKPAQTIQTDKARQLQVGVDTEVLAFIGNDSTIYVYKKSGETVAKFTLDNKIIKSIALDELSNVIYALCTDKKIYKISFASAFL